MNLLTQPIPNLVKQIAIPASTGILFNTLYNITDTFYAGLISTKALAALSLSFFVYFLLIGMGFGFTSAISALCGNSLGKKRLFLAQIYAQKGFFLMFLISIFVLFFGLHYSYDVLLYLGRGGDYINLAQEYLDVMFLSSPFLFSSFALNSILTSTGDTKTYRNMLIVGFFLNAVLNPVFMYGFLFIPEFGFKGIAYSTFSVQVISSFYLFYKVTKKGMIKPRELKLFLPHLRIYKNLLFQAVPSSLNVLSSSLGSIILLYFVAIYGEKAVAGYGIAFRVEQIALLPLFGISSAILSIVSNNYGAKKYDRIKQTLKLCFTVGFFVCLVEIILGLSIGKLTMSFFDSDLEVIKYGYSYLLIGIFISFGYAIHFFSNSFLQAIKKPNIIFFVGFYRQILALFPLYYLFVFVLHEEIHYLWVSIAFAVYSAAIFIGFYVLKVFKNLK